MLQLQLGTWQTLRGATCVTCGGGWIPPLVMLLCWIIGLFGIIDWLLLLLLARQLVPACEDDGWGGGLMLRLLGVLLLFNILVR